MRFADGHHNPNKTPSPHKASSKKWDVNDGRAPDTVDDLEKLAKPAFKTVTIKENQPPVALDNRALQSYPWLSPNSCFFDNDLELWYRAFQQWSPDARDTFFRDLDSKSVLASIFYHFNRRAKWELDSKRSHTDGLREFELCQTVLKNYIFDKWHLHEPGSYGCAVTWLHHAIKVGHSTFQFSS